MATQLTLATLLVKLQADVDEHNRRIRGAGQEYNVFEKNVEGLSKKVTAFAGGAMVGAAAAVAEFSRQSLVEFNTFEQGMAEVFTLMPGKSQAAYDQMTADVLAFSREVGRQTDETIPALYQSISAGVPPDNVFDFMQTASDAALAGVTDLETSVDGLSSVVNAYGADVIGAGEASDVMFRAVQLGKTTFDELANSLFNVIPTAASLGIQFSDVAANMAALTAQGTPTSVATTQLRQAFVDASKEGSKLADAIKNLTGQSFTDLIAEGKTSAQIFGDLRRAMPEDDFRNLFSSVEALNAALGLTNPTADEIIGSFGSMQDNMGLTAAAADTMGQTGAHAMAEFQAAVEGLKIAIGQELSGETTETLKVTAEFINTIAEGIDDIGVYARALRDLNPLSGELADAYFAAIRGAKASGQETRAFGLALDAVGEKIVNAQMSLGTLVLGEEGMSNVTQEVTRVMAKLLGIEEEYEASLRATTTAVVANATSLETQLAAQAAAVIEQRKAVTVSQEEARAIHEAALARAEAAGVNEELADKVAQTNSQMTEAEAIVYAGNTAVRELNEALTAEAAAQQEAAEATRQANAALFEFVNGAVSQSKGPIQDLITSQTDLTAAQGEWVQGTRNNTAEITSLHAQLAADLTDEQEDAMQEILRSTEEGGAEWLAAWNALQGDMTAAQRAELVAQLADLQSTHGDMQSVFTGDAAAAEEAQSRITAAYQEISRGYKEAAVQIFEAKIAAVIEEDGLAAAQAMIQFKEALGLISPEESAMLQEVATKTANIQEATSAMLDEYLTDGVLTQQEIENVANAVKLIEESSTDSAAAMQVLAENGISSLSALDSATITTAGYLTSAREAVLEFGGELDALNGRTVSVDVVTHYSSTGTIPGTLPSKPGEEQAFQSGGYTGDMAGVAGFVHGREFVWSPRALQNAGGPEVMDELHELAKRGPMNIMNSGNQSGVVNNIYPAPGMNPDQIAMEIERRQYGRNRRSRASGSYRAGR